MIKGWVIIHKNGKLARIQKMKSFVENFLKMLVRDIFYCDLKVYYADGEYRNLFNSNCRGKIGIGSDNTPVSKDDYCLKEEIKREGIEAWEIFQVENTLYLRLSKTFSFDSSYEIWETGLFSCRYRGSGENGDLLIARDVLESSISVNPGDVINVTYLISITI